MCVVFFGFMSTCISSIVRVAIVFLSIGLSEFLKYMIDPPPLFDGVALDGDLSEQIPVEGVSLSPMMSKFSVFF